MSVARLKYDLKELKSLDKKLIDVAEMANSPEIARKIAKVLWDNTLERFRSEKDPEGNAWKPTKRGGNILVKTSHLRDFIVSDSDETEVVIGTNTKYAAIHQFGGEIKAKTQKYLRFKVGNNWISKESVNIPARPYLGISGKDEEDISLIFGKMIEGLK